MNQARQSREPGGQLTASMAAQLMTPFLRELQRRGGEFEALARAEASEVFARLGLTMADVEALQVRLPHRVAIALLDMLINLTQDTGFALAAGERCELGDFEPYDYLCRHCATLGESIYAARDYMPLMHDGIEAELIPDGDVIHWRNRLMHGLEPSPLFNEFTNVALMASARRHTGLPLVANKITFMHERPPHADKLEEFFGSPVQFNASHNGFEMLAVGMEFPIPGADPILARTLRRHCDELLRSVPARRPFTHAVTELIARELEGSGPALKNVARLMHMSESTLRRRLRDEGRTHSEIVELARQQLARRLLSDPSISLTEVGRRLGFAHAPALHRAFKRWTGMTPAQFRAHANGHSFSRFLNPGSATETENASAAPDET